ncbi:MAG TPA: hypothetical protein HA362_06980 [Nanoarchaeota archaeon]|nr:hypothetical protein [Nanoarchaeota archaeon]
MVRIFPGLVALALAGCVHNVPFNAEYSEVRPLQDNTYAAVERTASSLRLSVYTLEEGYETVSRSWSMHVDATGECESIESYYLNEDEDMEATLTDDGCDNMVDSVYLPSMGSFGRGVMTEAQRQQADDGLRDITLWLSDYFDFNAETEAWREWKEL